MCQVSSREFDVADPCIDLCVDLVECALERSIDGAQGGKCGGQSWTQEPVVGAGKEQGRAQAEACGAIARAFGQALDQAVQAQAAQLIGDRTLRDRVCITSGPCCEMTAQIGSAEAVCELPEQDDGMPQRVDAHIGKTQT